MSKINCSLIKDLLPLYIDELCSNESTEIIKNHLEVCEECNKEYKQLKNEPILKEVNDNSSELIKGVGNMFKKDKKKAVLKTLAIILAIVIVISIVAFFKVPPYIAQKGFQDSGVSYPDSYQEWEICKASEKNFTHEAVDLLINEEYGEYEVVDENGVLQFKFADGKKIFVFYKGYDNIPTFEEDKGYFNELVYSQFMLPSVLKRGLENLGVDTSVGVGYDQTLEYTLIKTPPPEVKFFCSYDDYATACAYYSSYNICMPIFVGSQYYILAETEDLTAWGWASFKEDFNIYVLEYQNKTDMKKCYTIQTVGFTKEEAQEIFKYAVIK
jgi:hypothetical protein